MDTAKLILKFSFLIVKLPVIFNNNSTTSAFFLSEIENVINKYKTMAQSAAEGSKMNDAAVDDGDDDDEPDEEDNDIVDEDEKFENSKRKLRLVLCQADFQNLPLLHPDNRLPEKR